VILLKPYASSPGVSTGEVFIENRAGPGTVRLHRVVSRETIGEHSRWIGRPISAHACRELRLGRVIPGCKTCCAHEPSSTAAQGNMAEWLYLYLIRVTRVCIHISRTGSDLANWRPWSSRRVIGLPCPDVDEIPKPGRILPQFPTCKVIKCMMTYAVQ
jgi:hypothetical protein